MCVSLQPKSYSSGYIISFDNLFSVISFTAVLKSVALFFWIRRNYKTVAVANNLLDYFCDTPILNVVSLNIFLAICMYYDDEFI